jgi:signal transduction histidine kinase/DNA-binding response OmpR family regulator/HPt (histidine-containing phosphotransfer) domain-containing protein
MSSPVPQNAFSDFFAESSTAMAIADADGMILVSNASFSRLIGTLTGKAYGGGEPGALDFLSIHDAVRFSNFLSRLANGAEKALDFRAPFHDNAGKPHWFNLTGWPVSAAGGRPLIGFTLVDETEDQKTEEKLLADKQSAEEAAEAKSRFLATMSHEIRTPIQTVIGMAELLEDTKLDREQAEYLHQIEFSAEALLSLINDILDFSKIEAGRMEAEHIEFNLADIIEQAVQMISLEAHKKNLEIAADIPGGARLTIMGDPVRLRQVVINLVKNAVKFTEKGSVIVSAQTDEGGKNLTVSVADTGIGVSEEGRRKLFTSFMQADSATARRFGGTGLGLAISRRIVTELMRGSINMKSRNPDNPGEGSVFYFTVPLEKKGKAAALSPLPKEVTGLRILLTDDVEVSRGIIARCLGELGCGKVDTAASGEETLDKMKNAAASGAPYELCLIDMNMPRMDGWRLAAQINGDKAINGARLILMVPQGGLEGDAKMTLLKWFDGYVSKPLTLAGLHSALATILEGPAVEDASDGEAASAQDAGLDGPPYFAGLAVLVVEDHPVNQKLFAMIMEKLGVKVQAAGDGLEALEKAKAVPPDLVFMDIQMPRMNGYEAAIEFRRRGFDKPIIAVTASAFEDEQKKCYECGFDDILLKPSKRPDIEALLKKWTGPEACRRSWTAEVPATQAPATTAETAQATAPTAPAATVFSGADLTDTFMGDRDSAKDLLKKFVDRSEEQIAALPRLEQGQNWEEARRIAHTIKGSAATLSGKELGGAGAVLEKIYKAALEGAESGAAVTEKARLELAASFARFKKAAEDFLR